MSENSNGSCPLSYECSDPKVCFRLSLGLSPAIVDEITEAGFSVREKTLCDVQGSWVDICSGPLEQGMNSQAEKLESILPSLVEKGLVNRIIEMKAISNNLSYMAARNGLNQAVSRMRSKK